MEMNSEVGYVLCQRAKGSFPAGSNKNRMTLYTNRESVTDLQNQLEIFHGGIYSSAGYHSLNPARTV
jgi:hypothetical protein